MQEGAWRDFCASTGLTLYTLSCPIVHRNTHKAIRIYMGNLILGVNTVFCFFKLFIIGGKELTHDFSTPVILALIAFLQIKVAAIGGRQPMLAIRYTDFTVKLT